MHEIIVGLGMENTSSWFFSKSDFTETTSVQFIFGSRQKVKQPFLVGTVLSS
jgi:hypothetical protein